jgi:hypothetical protein
MFTVGSYEIDETKIAPAVTLRLLQRAAAHILNNECAANVLGKTKRAIVTGGLDINPRTVTKAEEVNDADLELFRATEAGQAQIDAWESDFCSAKIAAMYDGTLSVRVVHGPVRDPIEASMRSIALAELKTDAKNKGVAWPKKDGTMEITTPDGTVYEFTADEMVDRRLARPDHGERIRKLAERQVAEAARLKAAIAKGAAGDGESFAASLGLGA